MVDLRFIVISDRQIVSSIKKENVKVKDLGLVVTRMNYVRLYAATALQYHGFCVLVYGVCHILKQLSLGRYQYRFGVTLEIESILLCFKAYRYSLSATFLVMLDACMERHVGRGAE